MATKKTVVKTGKVKAAHSTKSSGKSRGAPVAAVAEAGAVVDPRSGNDRRGGSAAERRQKEVPVAVDRRKLERRVKVNRRRQIDPTTCERDYSPEEIEFMAALDAYKRRSGRMFPTCSEVLEVIRGLGYEKRPALAPEPQPATIPSDFSGVSAMAETVA